VWGLITFGRIQKVNLVLSPGSSKLVVSQEKGFTVSIDGCHIIVGWPRGGLGYVAELLHRSKQEVGFSFNSSTTHGNVGPRFVTAKPYELSSAIVPFLAHPDLKSAQVVFLVRDPMRVLNSLYFHGTFHGEKRTPQLEMACRYINGFQKSYLNKPVQAIVEFLVDWFDLALSKRPDAQIVRVELGNAQLIQKLTRNPKAAIPFCLPEVNASCCKQKITPSQLPQHSQIKMRNLLKRLGYLDSVWDPRGGHAHYVNPDWHC